MKKDYEEYRDTGVLGGYHPEMAVLQEQRGGEILTTFRDTNYQQREDYLESQREMLIRLDSVKSVKKASEADLPSLIEALGENKGKIVYRHFHPEKSSSANTTEQAE